jgi:hypothetical protein
MEHQALLRDVLDALRARKVRKKEENIVIRDRYRKWAVDNHGTRPGADFWYGRVPEWASPILLTNRTFIRPPLTGEDGTYA